MDGGPTGERGSVGWSGHVGVDDVELQVDVVGAGEPVVVIQTALDADELRPLAEEIARHGRHRCVHYNRRGYAGSSRGVGDGSIARDAADCRGLIAGLGLAPAHVLGASYSAAVALALACDAPASVRTLTVIEPPPVRSPDFLAANARLLETSRARGPLAAVDELMTMLVGPGWRRESDRTRPGTVAALERDAAAFFGQDVPALLGWEHGVDDLTRITCPVLCLGGADTEPFFARMRDDVLAAVPASETAVVPGAGHLVASSHPVVTAQLVVDFLDRHA